jgi:hypothetical protein
LEGQHGQAVHVSGQRHAGSEVQLRDE